MCLTHPHTNSVWIAPFYNLPAYISEMFPSLISNQNPGLCLAGAARISWTSSNDSSAEEIVKNWLKYSGDRSGGRKKREEKKKGSCVTLLFLVQLTR